MSEITLNGTRCARVALLLPRVGAWTADVEMDAETAPPTAVALAIGGRTWRGAVLRGAVEQGVWRGRILGGAGGLARTLGAVAQRDATLGHVLADILREAGELLSADAGPLTAPAARWHRHEAPATHAVGDVAAAAGYAWRVRADGRVWLGRETWGAFSPAGDVDVRDVAADRGRLVLAGDVLGIEPGQSLSLPGRAPVRVGCVEHLVDVDDAVAVVLTEAVETGAGRALAGLEAIVHRLTRRFGYLGTHRARVDVQHADGTLDLTPESRRLPSCQRVPYRTLPGLAVEIPAGTHVGLSYEDGDPARPVVTTWEPSTAVTRWTLNGSTKPLARSDDSTANGQLVLGPTGTVAGYIAPGGATIPTPPGGSLVTLSGVVTGSSIIRG